MTFYVKARRVDAHGSLALCKNTEIALDTNLARNPDAFKPAELLPSTANSFRSSSKSAPSVSD